jgi:undecaprenyl diphosphate synthase
VKPLNKLNHLAIIPDGNRRWAKKRSLRPWLGHEQGTIALEILFRTAVESGIHYVTFWGASLDNILKRSRPEVEFLLKITYKNLIKPENLNFIHSYKMRVTFLGEWKTFIRDEKLKQGFEDLERKTRNYHQNFLTILFAYDGKREMLRALDKAKNNTGPLTDKSFRKFLETGHLPDVDFVIRTGGQPHWSAGFMMWLTANSQFYFTDTLWPDFNKAELKKALRDYGNRERKMGT